MYTVYVGSASDTNSWIRVVLEHRAVCEQKRHFGHVCTIAGEPPYFLVDDEPQLTDLRKYGIQYTVCFQI